MNENTIMIAWLVLLSVAVLLLLWGGVALYLDQRAVRKHFASVDMVDRLQRLMDYLHAHQLRHNAELHRQVRELVIALERDGVMAERHYLHIAGLKKLLNDL